MKKKKAYAEIQNQVQQITTRKQIDTLSNKQSKLKNTWTFNTKDLSGYQIMSTKALKQLTAFITQIIVQAKQVKRIDL